jgi:hypothetical protein
VRVPIEHLGRWIQAGWTLMTASLVDYVIAQLLVSVLIAASFGLLTGPLLAGYFRFALKRSRGYASDFNDLFSALSQSFGATFVVGIVLAVGTVISTSLLAVLANLILGQIPFIGVLLQALLLLGGTIAISGAAGVFTLMLPLIHERGLTPAAALELCLDMLRTDWARAGLFGVVVGGLPALGSFVCGLGVLIGGPLGMLVAAQGYRATFDGR